MNNLFMLFDQIKKSFIFLIGDDRQFNLENRLFNTISLFSGLSNLVGILGLLHFKNFIFLMSLQLATGVFFLVCYGFSRFKNAGHKLYWPYIFITALFLFLNSLSNGGLQGGAHYYIFPALVIAIILSSTTREIILSFLLYAIVLLAIIFISYFQPDWIIHYSTADEQLFDVAGNLLFVEVFIGIVVLVLMKNLNLERSKSDRLLVNILPSTIAEELKLNDKVIPKEYDGSVLFTDFVGFTQVAEKLNPQELIHILGENFTQFDHICRHHHLEKIKTIGDSYMAAGGVPIANRSHAVDCVLAALEIRDFVATQKFKTSWRIRIGINSGLIVAGVIGREKFAYDVWGDTVNTASRLESSGVENEVNISQQTYERVKDFFICEYRGQIHAKNKGEIAMYLVKSLKFELQAHQDQFNKLYQNL